MITLGTIAEFKQALKQEYDKDVTLEEAAIILMDLVGYYDTLAKIHHDDQH